MYLGVGPNDLLIKLWIMVNPERLGGTQIPHCVGGEIQWYPCFFGVFCVFYESVNGAGPTNMSGDIPGKKSQLDLRLFGVGVPTVGHMVSP